MHLHMLQHLHSLPSSLSSSLATFNTPPSFPLSLPPFSLLCLPFPSFTHTHIRLVISDVNTDHSGLYTCRATNPHINDQVKAVAFSNQVEVTVQANDITQNTPIAQNTPITQNTPIRQGTYSCTCTYMCHACSCTSTFYCTLYKCTSNSF